MKNINLGILIAESICGLAGVGIGVYYCVAGIGVRAALFLVMGAVCIPTAIRTLVVILKEKKNKKDKDE